MRARMCSLAAGCLLVLGVCGCDRWESTSRQGRNVVGAVAVIDLDAVAQRLGRDKQMADSLQQRQDAINQQLTTMKVSYEKELSQKQTEFGKEPSQEQVQLLSNLGRQAGANLNQVQQKAKAELSQHHAALIQRFREEVKPVARQLAAEKGLSIIVTKNESVVFDFTPAVDITEDVIRRMQERQPAPAAAPAQQ